MCVGFCVGGWCLCVDVVYVVGAGLGGVGCWDQPCNPPEPFLSISSNVKIKRIFFEHATSAWMFV